MKSLKRGIAVILVGIVMISFLACGKTEEAPASASSAVSQTPEPSAQQPAPSEETKQPVTLTALMFTQYYNDTGFQAVLKDLTAETGITLDIAQVPDGEQGNTIFRTRFATRDLPDLMFYYSSGYTIAKEIGDIDATCVDQTNAEWTKNFDKKAWEYQSVNGKFYSAPYRGSLVLGVIYNKKIFTDLSIEIPKTYEDFLTASEKIKSAGKVPFYVSGKDGWTTMLLPWLGGSYGFTTDYVEQLNANKVKFKDNAIQKDALAKLLEIKEKGYINSDYLSATWDNSQQDLAEGKAAMYVNLSNTMDEIVKKFPDKVDDLGMFAFPFKGNGEDILGVSGTNGIFAFKGEKEQAAMDFINYFESIPVQNKFFGNQGGIPAIIGVTQTKLTKAELDGKAFVDAGKANAMWSTGLKYGFGDYGALCQELLVGRKTPEQVLDAVDKEFEKNAKAAADENFK